MQCSNNSRCKSFMTVVNCIQLFFISWNVHAKNTHKTQTFFFENEYWVNKHRIIKNFLHWCSVYIYIHIFEPSAQCTTFQRCCLVVQNPKLMAACFEEVVAPDTQDVSLVFDLNYNMISKILILNSFQGTTQLHNSSSSSNL